MTTLPLHDNNNKIIIMMPLSSSICSRDGWMAGCRRRRPVVLIRIRNCLQTSTAEFNKRPLSASVFLCPHSFQSFFYFILFVVF